ncbi:winged helix-turn-helix transcriptional regulator [Leptospira sp. 'Mane']|uniref:winged helix-turn-helix transcriptional regulator n=1 Tax=Leptospira sp. 'Mane' TaxID=3387407 RepID=UPI00398B6DF2
MKHKLRSNCPINFSLEMLGDGWSLLILRDIIYFGKKTYNEFLASDEAIARNILANRLVQLQEKGLLVKRPHPKDKRKEIYELTEDGLDLVPILLEMAEWGAKRVAGKDLPLEWLQAVRKRRNALIPRIQKIVRQGGSIFGEPATNSHSNLFSEIKKNRK